MYAAGMVSYRSRNSRLSRARQSGSTQGSSAVGEPAEVADAGKASRQYMLPEAAQELF
jgi:hypothetical protein